jgi:hypothetical protein
MSAHLVRKIAGVLIALGGAIALLKGWLPEQQASGVVFMGIAVFIWPKGGGAPKR